MAFRQLVRSTPRSVPVSTPLSKEGAGAEGSLVDQSEDLERRIVAATTRAVLGELSAWRTSVEREVACLRGRLAQVEERAGSVSENLRKLASISPFATPDTMEGKVAPTRQLATDASTHTVAEVAREGSQIISQEAMVMETRLGLFDEEEQDGRPAPTLTNADLNVSNIRATLQRVRRNLSRSPGGSSLQSSPLSSPRAASSLALLAAAAGAKEEPCEQSGVGGAAIELMSSATAKKPLAKDVPPRMSLQSQSSSRMLLVPSKSTGEFRFNSARASCDSSPPQKLLREGTADVPPAPVPAAESPRATNGMCSPTRSKPLLGASSSSPMQIFGCSPPLKPFAAARAPISAVGVGVGVGVVKPCVARSMVALPLQPGVGAPAQAAHRQ
jgi:hypothetical protein